MKILLLFFFVGFVSADFLEDAAVVVDKGVQAFLEGVIDAGSLPKALGIDDPELEQMAQDLENGLGEKVREALKDLLEKIKDHVDNGKSVGQELINKVKELRKQLKNIGGEEDNITDVLKKIREQAKEVLRKILEKLGLGKRNLDDSFDRVARMKFREIVDKIKEKILSTENIRNIKEYVKNINCGESEVLKKLKVSVSKLEEDELKKIIEDLLNDGKQQGETWDKLKNFFRDLNIKIQDHSRKFGEWVKDMWGKGLDKLKEKYGTIRAIAMEFIANSKDMSAEMSREALEFFRPYKDDLGNLWNQIVDVTKEAVGRF